MVQLQRSDLKQRGPFVLLVPEPSVDAPLVADHHRVDRKSGLRLNRNLQDPGSGFRGGLLRDLGQLSVVADESGDDDGDDGHEREEDEQGREAGDGQADAVHDLLSHAALKWQRIRFVNSHLCCVTLR